MSSILSDVDALKKPSAKLRGKSNRDKPPRFPNSRDTSHHHASPMEYVAATATLGKEVRLLHSRILLLVVHDVGLDPIIITLTHFVESRTFK
jgi:hypothetical protein